MHTALRAGALLVIAGVAAGAILIFATDPAEAPEAVSQPTMEFSLTSSAFAHGAAIPSRFTCDDENTNPPLTIGNVPEGTKSFVLIMHDPDVPKQLRPDGIFDHWVLFNIAPETTNIAVGEAPGVLGKNGAGKTAYAGPCPPPQYEPSEHRYLFKLFALDTMLDLKEGASKQEVQTAMEEHILGEATLMGRYRRVR